MSVEPELEERSEAPEELPAFEDLVSAGDVDGLIDLGAAHRTGQGADKDPARALECFEAAADLGSADAAYLVAVSYLNGVGVAQDMKTGAGRLRAAAQGGSLRAKVFLANLYELGVFYDKSTEKADVWYRNVARAAKLQEKPDSPEYDLAMAELGCVRQCLEIVADDSLPPKDRAAYLKKAKAMGYTHALRAQKKATQEAIAEAQAAAEAREEAEGAESELDEAVQEAAEADERREAEAKKKAQREKAEEEEREPLELGAQWTAGVGALSFLVATFFVAMSAGAAWLSQQGVRALVSQDQHVPIFEQNPDAILWTILVALGVLPTTTVYRPKVVAIATVLAAGAAAGGYYGFGSVPLTWDATSQGTLLSIATYLVMVFFLGMLGGSRLSRPSIPKPPK